MSGLDFRAIIKKITLAGYSRIEYRDDADLLGVSLLRSATARMLARSRSTGFLS